LNFFCKKIVNLVNGVKIISKRQIHAFLRSKVCGKTKK